MRNWFFSILFITTVYGSECRYDTRYNHFDLPTTITDTKTGLSIERVYDERGNLIEEKLLHGHSTKNVYDDDGHRTALILPDGSSIRYIYNKHDLTAVQRLDVQENILYEHRYLDTNHEEMVMGAGVIEWGFDEHGRRVFVSTPYGSEKIEAMDEQGHVLEMTRFNGPVSYEYDENYNLVEQTVLPHQDLQIQMDELGRVIVVEKPDSIKQFYEYDGLHRCSQMLEYQFLEGAWQPSKELFFIYDDQHEIGALDREGKLVQLKVLGKSLFGDVGNTVAIELEGNLFVPLNDLCGNIAALVSSIDHDVIEWYPYQAFGQYPISSPISPWRYWSKRTDPVTNLVNFGKRFYEPSHQKWIGGSEGDTFMNNNPLFHLDFYTQTSSNPSLSVRIGKIIKLYCFHVIPFMGVRNLGIKVGEWLGATDVNEVENDPDSHLGWVGDDESSSTAIVWINGLNTDLAETIDCASVFSDIFNHRVYYAYNQTHGFMADLWTHFGGQFYIYPPAVEIAIKAIRGAIRTLGGPDSGGKVIILAHSQGGAVLEIALSYLTEPELNMLHVHTFGTAALFDKGHLAEVHHNIARRDPFPFVADTIRLVVALARGSSHVTILDNPNGGLALVNHGILGPVYLPAITRIAQDLP